MLTRRSTTISSLALVSAIIVGACADGTPAPSSASTPAPPSVEATSSPVAAVTNPAPTARPSTTPLPAATPRVAASPVAAPTSSPTPVPTPTPWKAHRSKRFKYSVRYPPTWVVTPGSAKLADQFDDYTTHFVFISRDTVKGTASVSLTVEHDIATFKSHYKAKLVSNKRVTVRGWAGRLLTFNGRDDGRKVYIQHLVLAKGRAGYIIEMFSDRGNAKADRALFKRIYKSFKPRS